MIFLFFNIIIISSIRQASLQNGEYQEIESSNFESVVIITSILGTVGGLVGVWWGVYTYSKGQKLKKHEILFPLIKEFDEDKRMEHAKDLLDSYILEDDEWDHRYGYYSLNNLHLILKKFDLLKEGIKDPGERAIRKSFDALLDFFCKLEYLKDLKLIENKEVAYFNYYIYKVAKNDAIKNYIKAYEFPLYGKLHPSLSQTNTDSNDINIKS